MCAPRLPSVAPVSFFRRENSSPVPDGNAFSAAMILSRSGWWMMSSSSAISNPAHPEAAQDQPAAVDGGHPQQKRAAGDEEIANQRQDGDTEPDGNKGAAEP